MVMMSSTLGHVVKTYDLIFSSISVVTTNMIIDQHGIALANYVRRRDFKVTGSLVLIYT